jgi:hypothetical protein
MAIGLSAGTTFIKIEGDLDGFKRSLGQAEGIATRSGTTIGSRISSTAKRGLSGLGSAIGNAVKYGTVAAGAAIGVFATKAVNAASDLGEAINKVDVIFGNSADSVQSWSKTTAGSFGIARAEALEAAGGFGSMLQTAGLAVKESSKMSTSLVELAADMASFNNQDPSEMLQRLRSGLAGEAEPLRQFGVFISEAAIKTQAYKDGIAATGAELTEAQKVQARYNLIMAQTVKQQGDVARTADSFPNLMRKFTAQFTDLAATIGTKLLPVATAVLKWLTEQLPTAFKSAGDLVSGIVDAFKSLGSMFTSTGNSAKSFGDVWTRVWTTVKGFIDRILPDIKGTIKDTIEIVRILWRQWGDDLMRIAKAAWAFISQVIESGLKIIRNTIKVVLALLKGDWGAAWDGIKNILSAVWDVLSQTVKSGIQVIKSVITGALSTIKELWTNVWNTVKRVFENAWNFMLRILGNATAAIIRGVGFLVDKVFAAFGMLIDMIVKVAEKLAFFLPEKVSKMVRDLDKSFDKFRGDVKGSFDAAAASADAWGEKTKSAFNSVTGPAKTFAHLLRDIRKNSNLPVNVAFTAPKGDGLGFLGTAKRGTPTAMAQEAIAKYGGALGSGYRPGSITASGNLSLHSIPPPNNARDFVGSATQMLQSARFLAAKYGSRLKELIHTPLGFGIKNGKRVGLDFWGETVNAMHHNHVHVADRGGMFVNRSNSMGLVAIGPRVQEPVTFHGAQKIGDAPASRANEIHIHGDVYGFDDFKKKVSQATTENVFNLIGT